MGTIKAKGGQTLGIRADSAIPTDMNPADGPFADAVKGMIAVGRYVESDEIAGLVAYLAGPEAAFVTGASLTI